MMNQIKNLKSENEDPKPEIHIRGGMQDTRYKRRRWWYPRPILEVGGKTRTLMVLGIRDPGP